MPGSDAMKPHHPGVKLTYDDFVLFPDDGKRHELIDGEHYVTPSPNTRHQQISVDLLALIWTYLEAHPIGRVFHAPYDVVFSNFDVVEPDLLYVSNERAAEVVTPQHVRGVPDIVVEIGSPVRASATRRSSDACMNGPACLSTGSSIPRRMWFASTGEPRKDSTAPSSCLVKRTMCSRRRCCPGSPCH